jgi:hemoglobin-like flavoprotein
MDVRHIALVQQCFEQIAGVGERLSEAFYAELFGIGPSLRAMFDGDMNISNHSAMLCCAPARKFSARTTRAMSPMLRKKASVCLPAS